MHFEGKLFPWEPTDEGLLPLWGEIISIIKVLRV